VQHIIKSLACVLATSLLTACVSGMKTPETVDATAVIHHYADIAEAKYTDSLTTAKALDTAIRRLLANPGTATLHQAKTAWLAARVPYQQTEVYRFGNAIVDDWEGRVNAWPLDEGLIDYVDASYGNNSDANSLYTANVIANTSLMVDGRRLDTSRITPDLIANQLQEAGGIEANVASGYHAIEFLLWGQDLNGASAGAGNRPYTDYSLNHCTNGHCERRRQYLTAASQLLVSDLQEMVTNWQIGGAARQALLNNGTQAALSTILTGMGSLSYGELAGERMKLGLLLGDPEEEHDCFSDNTHNSHYYDTVGIRNIYLGTYTRIDGSRLSGPSIGDLVSAANPAVDAELKADLQATEATMQHLVQRAEQTEAYDQMIATNNPAGNTVVTAAIDALIQQTASIERAIAALQLGNIALEGSDSLDNPTAVFQ
jgi:putative iron-regulated protein